MAPRDLPRFVRRAFRRSALRPHRTSECAGPNERRRRTADQDTQTSREAPPEDGAEVIKGDAPHTVLPGPGQ